MPNSDIKMDTRCGRG